MSDTTYSEITSERTKSRLRLWLRLLTCTTQIEQTIRSRLRQDFETTLPRFDVLASLARAKDGMTMTDLSRQLMVSNGNVTGLIDRMTDEGLVMRMPHPEDRRSSYVMLSEKGRQRFEEMAAEHARWIDELFDGLDEKASADLSALLGVLKDSSGKGDDT